MFAFWKFSSSVQPNNDQATCFGKVFVRIFSQNCFGFLSFFRHFGRSNLCLQKGNCLAETLLFWQKDDCFSRDSHSGKGILFLQKQLIQAETACFGRINLFQPLLVGYLASVKIQGCQNAKTAKSLFRSNTIGIYFLPPYPTKHMLNFRIRGQ